MIITILAAHDEVSEYLQYFLSGSTLSWKTTNNTNTTNIRRREKSRNDVIVILRNNWIYILDVRKLRISFRNNVRSTVCVCVCVRTQIQFGPTSTNCPSVYTQPQVRFLTSSLCTLSWRLSWVWRRRDLIS